MCIRDRYSGQHRTWIRTRICTHAHTCTRHANGRTHQFCCWLLCWFSFRPSVRSVFLGWLVVWLIGWLFTSLLCPRLSIDSTMRTRRTVPITITTPTGERIRRVTTISPTGEKTIHITQLSPAPATASAVAHGSATGEPTERQPAPTPEPQATAAAAEGRTLSSAMSSPLMMQPMLTTPSEMERDFFSIPSPANAGATILPDARSAMPTGMAWTGTPVPTPTSQGPFVPQFPTRSL